MRNMSRFSTALLYIAFLLVMSGSLAFAGVNFCQVVQGYSKINQRLYGGGVRLGNRINARIASNVDIPGSSRFASPDTPPRAQALFQIRLALGRCEHHWPNGADEQTLEMLSEMLLDRRVIDAVDVDYEIVGAGFGKIMARYVGNDANDRARKFITNLRKKLDEEPFKSKGYTEAHYFRDVNGLFEEFPSGDRYTIPNSVRNFVDTQTPGGASGGVYLEVVLAGRRNREVIRQISVDQNYVNLQGVNTLPGVNTGIDLLTNKGAYNVARSLDTIADFKLDTPDKIKDIAKAIVQARADGNPYKFVVGIPDTIPDQLPAKLKDQFDLLNAEIENVPGVPADFPKFTKDDIVQAFDALPE